MGYLVLYQGVAVHEAVRSFMVVEKGGVPAGLFDHGSSEPVYLVGE